MQIVSIIVIIIIIIIIMIKGISSKTITKTHLFKYIENFTSKSWKSSIEDLKNSDIFFHISAQNCEAVLTSTRNLCFAQK